MGSPLLEKAIKAGADAQQRELWTNAISAVQEVIGASVTHTDIRTVMLALRRSFTELADGVPDDPDGLVGRWLASAHVRLAQLLNQAGIELEGKSATPEEIMRAHDPANYCAADLLRNLRMVRKLGGPKEFMKELSMLASIAENAVENAKAEDAPGDY